MSTRDMNATECKYNLTSQHNNYQEMTTTVKELNHQFRTAQSMF